MAINIIDGFYLGGSSPIDNRIVASDSTIRTSISHKYDGLKVFQQDTRENWTWNSVTGVWDLDGSNESWMTIGGGGTFSNGQSVPNYNYATVYTPTIQVRKTSSGKIAIRGIVDLAVPWMSGQTLFTLPVGYRPSVASLVAVKFEASNVNISLLTGGALIVSGYTGLTQISIAEIEISTD